MNKQNEEVIWVRLDQTIDAAWLDANPEVRCLCSPTTGLDHIDVAECERRGIEIISLNGDTEFLRSIPATSELTIGLMLALLRKIPVAAEHARNGGWERERFQGRDLADCTVGIVGYGRIGRQVERMLLGFGCRVTVTNDLDYRWLGICDVVTVHVPLTEDTRSMFSVPAFAAMKPGAYFVNTSRGDVVHEDALIEQLEDGHLAGAALDVIHGERKLSDSRREQNRLKGRERLLAYAQENPNKLILTPHIGGNSQPSRALAEQRIAEKLAAWKKGLATQAASG